MLSEKTLSYSNQKILFSHLLNQAEKIISYYPLKSSSFYCHWLYQRRNRVTADQSQTSCQCFTTSDNNTVAHILCTRHK